MAGTVEDQLARAQRDVDGTAGRLVGPFGQRRRRLEAPATEFGYHGQFVTHGADAVEQAGVDEHVGHHVMRAGVADLVIGPRPRQELDEARVVHRGDRRRAPVVGCEHREPVVGGEHTVDRVGAAGVLPRRLEGRRLDLGQRCVAPVHRRRDDREGHVSRPERCIASDACGSASTAARVISRPSRDESRY